MANPSARAPRTPVTVDVTNPENPPTETIQAKAQAEDPPPPPPDHLEVLTVAGKAQAEAATRGKPTDVVEVYNRHVGRVAGLDPMSKGRVRRAMLDRYSWALRLV